LPTALGVLGLTTDEFEALTKREYMAKRKGFCKQQKQQAWMIGKMSGWATNQNEKCPYPSLDKFIGDESGEKETDEELFRLAQEKGIKIPEGVI
jgi:hypothetical protein